MNTLSGLELAYSVTVVFLAYGLRGSTGFGGAVGMPLLALVIPLKVLLPVWTLLGAASSAAILGRDRKHVAGRDFVAFIPWCLIGIAIGLYFFKTLDERTLAQGLGMMLLAYGGWSLWLTTRPPQRQRLTPRALGPVAGVLSGTVGTLFGTMGSIFFAIYLDARRLAKDAFRATVSAMLLTLSVVRGIGYYAVGEFSLEAWIIFALLFPVMLAGIWAGDRVYLKLSELAFKRLVSVTFILCGVPLLLK